MKKIIDNSVDVIFMISLALLGKFNSDSFELYDYQIIVTLFWVAGIIKFMNSDNSIKDEMIDAVKDFLVSCLTVPLWYWISGSKEYDIYEPASVVVHFAVLMIIILLTQQAVKLSGKVAYYTHAIIPVIAIILIHFKIPVVIAIIIAVIFPEPINYMYFKRKSEK